MKYGVIIFLLLSLFISLENAIARPIISGISTNEVDIDTSFTGAEILLFGAKGDSGDIVVVVRGPRKHYILNKKGETLGIWHTEKRVKFKNSYSYYAFFSSGKNVLEGANLLSGLEIGIDNIKLNASTNMNENKVRIFQEEFVNKMENTALYSDNSNQIEFLDETLFKVILKFPKNISSGVYTAEIYLIDEDNLLAFQAIPIYVNQVGISAKINDMAHNNSVLYGLIAICIAVISGWLANFIFNKFFGK